MTRQWRTGPLRDEVEPRGLQTMRKIRRLLRSHARITQCSHAYPVRCPRELLTRILEEDGYSGSSSVEERDDDGVDDRIEPFDGLGYRSTELSGAECAGL